MSQCKSCGAEIIWCQTPAGKLMPLDSRPETRWVFGEAAGHGDGTRTARSAQTYMSHFATCPDAAQHRRSR